MSVLAIVSCIVLVGSILGDYADDQKCTKAKADFGVCRSMAYKNYTNAMKEGDDKSKPDWLARKSCSYLTESVEECGNKLIGVCYTKEEVDNEKDRQLEDALVNVRRMVPNWDSSKCPAMKAHEDRLSGTYTPQVIQPESVSKADTTTLSMALATLVVHYQIHLA